MFLTNLTNLVNNLRQAGSNDLLHTEDGRRAYSQNAWPFEPSAGNDPEGKVLDSIGQEEPRSWVLPVFVLSATVIAIVVFAFIR